MKQKTLNQLMKLVSNAYPDDVVWLYYKDPDGDYGDTLAKFVAIECREVADRSVYQDFAAIADDMDIADKVLSDLQDKIYAFMHCEPRMEEK
jgi:hypothetical protein